MVSGTGTDLRRGNKIYQLIRRRNTSFQASEAYRKVMEEAASTIELKDAMDKMEVVLGLCEGEIEGLENGEKSFYIDDTKLQNENGDYNFPEFILETYAGSGTESEELNYFLGGAARSNNVGVQLEYNTPVVRETQSGDIDYIEIRLVVNQLYQSYGQNDAKQTWGTVKLKIEYKPVSATKWIDPSAYGYIILKGKIYTNFVQELRIEVSRIDEPYEIRVTKLSEEPTDQKSANAITFESFQEGNLKANSFPNTALAHIYCQYSDVLSSVPQFYGIYKLLKVRIPSNYDPITRTYDGDWDGTFKRAWTDNPAWCLYDFIMNDRYGVNAYAEVDLDKWDVYEAGQWCDEKVKDGKGGLEPRYSCNLLITEATNGREYAVYMASSFNAMLIESAVGVLRLKVEKDDSAVFLFTPENVTEEGFSYSFTSPETRYNDITVSFTNPDLNWTEDRRRIFNQEDIDKNGRVTYEFAAVGCISSGEAQRRAYYKMITSLTEVATVQFTTNRQAQCLSNYDIILIADPVLGYSLPGRIKTLSEDRKTIYLRDAIYLEAGIEYKISFNLPDRVFETTIERVSGSGNLKELQVTDVLPENLPELAAFTVHGGGTAGTPKPFRVLSVAEKDGNPDLYEVTALELNRNKWDAADNMEFSAGEEFSGLPPSTNIPHILNAEFFETYNPLYQQLILTIVPTLDTVKYPYYSGSLVVYSREVGTTNWIQRDVINDNTIINHPAGKFEFVILPLSLTGLTPPFETADIYTYTVTNVGDAPSNVKNLRGEQSINGIQLTWDPVDDIDLVGYEVRAGHDWETGEVITETYMGNTLFITIKDSAVKNYMVCAVNALGMYSPVPAIVSTSVASPDDVPQFYVTINRDNVRFDWKQVEGIDIVYVIRQGNNWSTAVEVVRTKGNNATVLLPSTPGSTYSIKALSPAGLFSINPRYANPDVELYPNRNVIIEIDNAAEGFPGVTYGFEPLTYIDKTMAMMEEYSYAEHYFPVHLDKVTRARNWIETEAFSFGKRLTWEDMHYRYTQPEAHRTWINSKALDSDGEIETVIITKKPEGDYKSLLGFSYNNTLVDMNNKVQPTDSTNISYEPLTFVNGLVINQDTYVEYENEIAIPEIFNMTLKLKVTDESGYAFKILSLKDGDKYLQLFFNEYKLTMRTSDHKNLEIDARWAAKLDFLTIGISQSETERSLYFYSAYGNVESQKTITAKPIGTFTSYYVNKL